MRRSLLLPMATVLLLAACQPVAAPETDKPVAALDGNPALTASPRTADQQKLMEIAERLAAEYESGRRPFPAMSADPRDSVSPESLRVMEETANRLATAYDGRNAD
ncbi:hypothetical protein [Longimicrobium terrae]|uniref:Uncharacterized protein n=1 Tax=Longimicrobium terrae TaxID=1639882 RepID=A0A841GLF0_9BACT|nr:hypothetical protein [Longimicrobium terrae]MBB4635187.1 hypothetical protein [Longimicrobium terrae]MBB6069581.1 hypothetical protein [Longimicrobium terrae]NNC31617.1 hypothetical protein [Longimicrobium terrae]